MVGLEQDLLNADGFCVVLVKSAVKDVQVSRALSKASISPEHIRQSSADGWALIQHLALNPSKADEVAEELSKELSVETISVLDDNTSGWFAYSAFEDGSRVHSYSLGFLDEGPPPSGMGERILMTEDEEAIVVSGFGENVSDEVLLRRHAFVDALLKARGAFLGWEAVES